MNINLWSYLPPSKLIISYYKIIKMTIFEREMLVQMLIEAFSKKDI